MKISDTLPGRVQSAPLQSSFHHAARFRRNLSACRWAKAMRRSLFSLCAGALMLAGSPLVQASYISDPAAVTPGGITTATADFGNALPGFFDLQLVIPSSFRLRSIYDDPSDGPASYQRYATVPTSGGPLPLFEAASSTNPADFTSLVGSFYYIASGAFYGPYYYNMPSFIASNGTFGIRAIDTVVNNVLQQGIGKLKLEFEALSTATPGVHTIQYAYDVDGNSTPDWQYASFNINVVPEPALGLLMLTGLGVLFVVRRRRPGLGLA